ncbi:ribosomal-protein-alanine N-acetyltransferase [Occultella glacieicola]|uniref:Ribosomal-protein-alanine N-acetyltransferase n=1 Tax=Occultella glacieicola TaxID=2518684 RepID=A0ABY2E8I2_9MICO|nr:ribosomal protein S18-alanine N-acetyltransferase [Occultella glacieicola]TDE97630.1 ribosomal-protein-alanine N-acetyltransferase [Occultella glacieicola]
MSGADLDRVIELEPVLFGAGAWSRASYESELARSDRHYVVVETEPGLVVGYAGVALAPESTVMTIGVAPTHRRRGLARLMLAELIARARSVSAEAVFLEVRLHDEGAQALYRSFGFEALGVRRRYYQPEGADALVMRLPLERPHRRGLGPVGAEAIEE